MLRALLFDLDGTLADTDPLHFVAWQRALAGYGLPIDEAFYRERISGRLNPDIVWDVLPQLSEAEGAAFVNAKEAAFREAALHLPPIAGALPLLEEAARRGVALALVTNAPGENAAFVLEALGIRGNFAQVVLAEHLPRGKPWPDPYQEALRLLKVGAGEAVAFEDSPSGVRSAVAAGIKTVALTTGHPAGALVQAGAALVVPDFEDERLGAFLGFAPE